MSRICEECDVSYGPDRDRKCQDCPERDRKPEPRQMDLTEWLDRREQDIDERN